MPVPLEKTIELRELVLGYVANSKVIDDITVRRVSVELNKIPSHESRLMLKALLSVAKNDSVAAIYNFEEYIRHYPSAFSYSDYIAYLATTAQIELAYEKAKIAYRKFGRKYGHEILIKQLNVFKSMFDAKMVNSVFDDLICIEPNNVEYIRNDVSKFINNYDEFVRITNSSEDDIRRVISIACRVVSSRYAEDVKVSIEEIIFSKNECEKECGVTIYISNINAEVASEMNFELVDLLAANDAFPNGSWALWFEPVRTSVN